MSGKAKVTTIALLDIDLSEAAQLKAARACLEQAKAKRFAKVVAYAGEKGIFAPYAPRGDAKVNVMVEHGLDVLQEIAKLKAENDALNQGV